MKKKVMKKWTAALRSGSYKQRKGYLSDGGAYCCLGVLCELAPADVRAEHVAQYKEKYEETLSPAMMKWADIKDMEGRLPKEYKKKGGSHSALLTDLNDSGLSFKQIANIIERNYKEL